MLQQRTRRLRYRWQTVFVRSLLVGVLGPRYKAFLQEKAWRGWDVVEVDQEIAPYVKVGQEIIKLIKSILELLKWDPSVMQRKLKIY